MVIELFNANDLTQNLGCFHSAISNGKSTQVAGVKYATLGLAAAALVISAASSANGSAGGAAGGGAPPPPIIGHPIPTGAEGSGGAGGVASASSTGPGTNVAAGGWHPPGFAEFFTVLQGISVSGMYSLNYPSTYRSFTQNMGWSSGIITWPGMQVAIDNFRNRTGGNLTESSFTRLQQTTLVYRDRSNANQTDITISDSNSMNKRMFHDIFSRANTNSTVAQPAASADKKYVNIVTGIRAYVEQLSVPNANTFMTLLIWFAIIVGICIIAILSIKLTLEIWSIRGNKKNKFEGFRKRYHLFLVTTLVRLVILFYGLWVLYCFYQFKIGDSWGALLLASLVFSMTSIVLMGFTIRIAWLAHVASKQKGGLEYLFKHKPWIRMYGLFYDQFKVKYWWCFIPTLMASFGRNAFISLGYGNGLVQVIGQIVIDVLMVGLYITCLPFNTRMGNGINIAIQVVRLISSALLLTFAVQLNLSQITTTGIGLALIVIQAILTLLLILLMVINACIAIFKLSCGGKRNKSNEKTLQEKELADQEDNDASLDKSFRTGTCEASASSLDEKHPLHIQVIPLESELDRHHGAESMNNLSGAGKSHIGFDFGVNSKSDGMNPNGMDYSYNKAGPIVN